MNELGKKLHCGHILKYKCYIAFEMRKVFIFCGGYSTYTHEQQQQKKRQQIDRKIARDRENDSAKTVEIMQKYKIEM